MRNLENIGPTCAIKSKLPESEELVRLLLSISIDSITLLRSVRLFMCSYGCLKYHRECDNYFENV